jgi:hypothetical protein
MDTLPQEVIDRIVYYTERYEGQQHQPPLLQFYESPSEPREASPSLEQFDESPSELLGSPGSGPSKYPPYATLSRSWKAAIEIITFHDLDIKSTELDTFKAIVTGNRRKYLTELKFSVVLPEYAEEAYRRVEDEEEQRINDEAFTKGIRELFCVLKAWEDEDVQSALRLEFSPRPAYSPTDSRLSHKMYFTRNGDIGCLRWKTSLLRIVQPDILPTLLNVQTLHIKYNGLRKLAPRVGPDLATLLPNLEHIFWKLEDDADSQLVGVRSDNRVAFVEVLKRLQLRRCFNADIEFHSLYRSDQRVPACPSIVPPGLTYDPLSAGLRLFSQNLTSLTLGVQVDSTLFWPSDDESDAAAPTWPHLRELEVEFNMVSPSGAWYFTGTLPADYDPISKGIFFDDGETDHTNYREYVDDTLHPFLCAFTKALKHMPLLERYELSCKLHVTKGSFHMCYYAPGEAADEGDEDEDDVKFRRLYFEGGKEWRPDHEIMQGLRCAGEEKFGGRIIEKFFPIREAWNADFGWYG